MKKVAVITGASSGIGEALATVAAEKGYNLALIARNADNLEAVASVCRSKGADVLAFTGDVSREADCKGFVEAALQKFGTCHVLINNAGISMRAVFNHTSPDVLARLMDINFWGTVYCTKYALPALLENKGSVVGVSSVAGFKGLPGRTGYSASKFAMQGFLESLRCENLETGLHVLIACPGYTASNIRKTALGKDGSSQKETPLDESKLMSAETVAEKIWAAVESRKKYLVLTFKGKMAVWINKWWPGLADRLAYNLIKKEPDSPF